jgi:hypothetical protein
LNVSEAGLPHKDNEFIKKQKETQRREGKNQCSMYIDIENFPLPSYRDW